MTADYKRYLAERVLNEQEHVTYRSLSRALKVHCDHAKRMLYDFHRAENAKKPKSVNATYFVIGTPEQTVRRPENGTHAPGDGDGDDEIMQSSPFTSSQAAQPDEAEQPTTLTEVRLVREEELPDVKGHFNDIVSIFVYSVQSTSPQDLNVLADLGHTVLESQPEDPLECGPRYGMIQNKNVKRRTRAGPPPVAPPPATAENPQAAKSSSASKPVKKEPTPPKEEEQQQQAASAESAPAKSQSQIKSTERASQSKRGNASIFKAFAKTKPKAQKEEDAPGASAMEAEKPPEPEDVIMGDYESEEEEREDLFLDTGAHKTSQPRESRKDREDKLKQMMDDEEMADAADEQTPENPPATEQPAAEEPPPAEPDTAEATEATEAPSGSRRRRGRRQVMKKKTTRDAEGYLVTQEEPAWESFSEDETQPPPKRKPAVAGASKPGKAGGGGKAGQGNIMSFFGKKQ